MSYMDDDGQVRSSDGTFRGATFGQSVDSATQRAAGINENDTAGSARIKLNAHQVTGNSGFGGGGSAIPSSGGTWINFRFIEDRPIISLLLAIMFGVSIYWANNPGIFLGALKSEVLALDVQPVFHEIALSDDFSRQLRQLSDQDFLKYQKKFKWTYPISKDALRYSFSAHDRLITRRSNWTSDRLTTTDERLCAISSKGLDYNKSNWQFFATSGTVESTIENYISLLNISREELKPTLSQYYGNLLLFKPCENANGRQGIDRFTNRLNAFGNLKHGLKEGKEQYADYRSTLPVIGLSLHPDESAIKSLPWIVLFLIFLLPILHHIRWKFSK